MEEEVPLVVFGENTLHMAICEHFGGKDWLGTGLIYHTSSGENREGFPNPEKVGRKKIGGRFFFRFELRCFHLREGETAPARGLCFHFLCEAAVLCGLAVRIWLTKFFDQPVT